MELIIHYCKCAINLMILYIGRFQKKCVLTVKKIYKVIRCVSLLFIKNSSLTTENEKYDCNHCLTSKTVHHEGTISQKIYDLTIIIPIYNVEKFIEECLSSVLNQQTQYSFEVIIIDDGSTDYTVEIIQSKFKDARIKLIRQDNAGQSAARNSAITMANGKYIMFVDGDDLLLPGAVEKMMDTAYTENADIVEGEIVSFQKTITEDMLRDSMKRAHVESDEINPKFVLTCYGYSVAKVYKHELWCTLRFPEGYIFEDVITKFILRRKANKVVFLGDVVYGYRRSHVSSSHGNHNLKILDSIRIFPQIVALCQQEEVLFDDIFYLLSLNHIGLLNYVTVRNQSDPVKKQCFGEMQRQLTAVIKYKTKRLPFMFRLLEKAILDGNMEAWLYTADAITEFGMLKKWREIN